MTFHRVGTKFKRRPTPRRKNQTKWASIHYNCITGKKIRRYSDIIDIYYEMNNTHFKDKGNPGTIVTALKNSIKKKLPYCGRCFVLESEYDTIIRKSDDEYIRDKIHLINELRKIYAFGYIYKQYRRICYKLRRPYLHKKAFYNIVHTFQKHIIEETIETGKLSTFDSYLIGAHYFVQVSTLGGLNKFKYQNPADIPFSTEETTEQIQLRTVLPIWDRNKNVLYRSYGNAEFQRYIASLTDAELDKIPKSKRYAR